MSVFDVLGLDDFVLRNTKHCRLYSVVGRCFMVNEQIKKFLFDSENAVSTL